MIIVTLFQSNKNKNKKRTIKKILTLREDKFRMVREVLAFKGYKYSIIIVTIEAKPSLQKKW